MHRVHQPLTILVVGLIISVGIAHGSVTQNHIEKSISDPIEDDFSLSAVEKPIVDDKNNSLNTQTTLRALPASRSNVTTLQTLRKAPQVNTTVAVGDYAVLQYNSSSLVKRGNFSSPPGANLIYAEPGLSNQPATHIITVSGSDNGTRFRNITVNYDMGDAGNPSNLSNITLDHIGIDASGDERIDFSLQHKIQHIKTPSDGVLRIELVEEYVIDEDDGLLLQYDGLRNPQQTGADDASVTLGNKTIPGIITYGQKGYGAFGQGIDLNVSSDILTPIPFDYVVDRKNGSLYVIVPTDQYVRSEPTNISVSLISNSARGNESTLYPVSFRIVDKQVSIDLPNTTTVHHNTTVTVTGTTTLAPDSKIGIWEITRKDEYWELVPHRTTVRDGREFTVRIKTPTSPCLDTITLVPKVGFETVGDLRTLSITNYSSDASAKESNPKKGECDSYP